VAKSRSRGAGPRPGPAEGHESGDGPAALALAGLIDRHRFPEGYRRMFLAAVGSFSERGFHGTTTREIAARAGLSPAALYVHFGSKEEVLYRIASSALDLTLEVVSEAADPALRPADRLQSVVRALTAWHAYHSATARVVLYQLDALTPEHLTEVTGKQREIGRAVRQIIAEGRRTGEFTATDIAGAATATLSLCLDVARWYRPGHRRTPEEISALNAAAALRVVGAR
jgi:AcrR family transcriptional regulator